ncbi:Aspartyl/glutamyl-tRNA(Asn/Gln) amidotransferase subunit B (Asp/Glu-ADT subunit B) [Candidatus Glomeribacter gigasporarum BEG34]|uniref:Aspartyl/glutamyl-tRNA(Asn/Gln) amidotransferase subunit B n=1 Tax=Candidatus Glomeribacter gigasporarum BEG34 TaxID=1070319 RepID=G2JAV0_9BURK|nr:Aspartyl/glutamyl-tRNA(Asn/Gln) amidotransferase subunit B (Asp/Glu-ADT subunit B) [Candidatus Glomeribacter gigasporarum BEG34]
MNWEIIIGLETHVQLSTVSKLFSGASTRFGALPNMQASVVDLALPGVLPVANRGAVERAILFGLAINARIAPQSVFARKHYFYPDLPKGYQISQHDQPVIQNGALTVEIPARGASEQKAYQKTVRIARAHLEEDAGKSLHEAGANRSGMDLNRAGIPLLEIVTAPDLRTAAEALAYAKALHALVVWLGICDGNMQEGSFRCDVNVSVRPSGQSALGVRCEIKNLNSFRFMEAAIQAEACRQIERIEEGGAVEQETRLYDPERRETRPMRNKEDTKDYRYFSDPDLLPLIIDTAWVAQMRTLLPILPDALRARWKAQYGLGCEETRCLTASRALARYYEMVMKNALDAPEGKNAQEIARMATHWIIGELTAQLHRDRIEMEECPISPAQLACLLTRIQDGTVSNKAAKEVFQTMWEEKARDIDAADRIIKAKGLRQISESGALESVINAALAAYPEWVEEFRAGKTKAFNALVGQVMKATSGQANPQQVSQLLKSRLEHFSVDLPEERARRQYGDRCGRSRSPSQSDGGDPAAIPNTRSREAT